MEIRYILPAKFLIPLEAVSPAEKLIQSVCENGILVPAVICSGIIVDGHQRIKAAIKAGVEKIPVIEATGEPFMLFAELNQHRQLQPLETAIAFSSIENQQLRKEFCRRINLSESPQMSKSLTFIARNFQRFPAQNFNCLPLNIWRELGHIETGHEKVLADFLKLEGTVGEKRLLAGLLRQCERKNALPLDFPGNDAGEVIEFLNSIAQPRRTDALKKYETLVASLEIPAGVSFKIDPTFDKPGLDISIHVKRNTVDRCNKAGKLAEQIFAEVEEL